jgi:peptidoglycan/xylan/chitin deacetylase (PgdA/CDA1 family)
MTQQLIVTTSWDDGHPADLKLAGLLADCDASGTFYVPTRNAEGRPVLSPDNVRRVAARFEIGGHSRDHVVLTQLPPDELDRQVRENKAWLEETVGSPIRGFCYVRGRYNAAVRDAVVRAGYAYARTVENFRTNLSEDVYTVPTTLQFYPHTPIAQLKTFRRGAWTAARFRLLITALGARDLPGRLDRVAHEARRAGGLLHIWGHSWELEEYELWHALRETLGRLAKNHGARFVTNDEAVSTLRGHAVLPRSAAAAAAAGPE